MARQRFIGTNTTILIFTVAIGAWLLCGSTVFAQGRGGGGGGRHGSGGGGHQPSGPSDPRQGYTPPPRVILMPHGGEYLSTETNDYEIVFMPLQVRIYLFDKNQKPLSARDIHAQMSLQVPMENTARHVPFQYVVVPAGVAEQDYVVALFDMRQLSEKETPVKFELAGLPDSRHPTVSFSPIFSPSKIRPYVAQVRLTESDRDGISRQQVCPVSGAALGSRGPVVKLYIADYPLYLSGEDCIAAVKETPERFLPQPRLPVAGP